jgi:hypothetical protein
MADMHMPSASAASLIEMWKYCASSSYQSGRVFVRNSFLCVCVCVCIMHAYTHIYAYDTHTHTQTHLYSSGMVIMMQLVSMADSICAWMPGDV